MALRCTGGVRVFVSGSGMHPKLHCTHAMTLERVCKYLCQLCRGQYTSGGKLSLKLKRPCKVRGGWPCRCVFFVQKKSRDDGPMTVMLALSTIGCRLQTFAGCSEIEIGCTHGRKRPEVLHSFICEGETHFGPFPSLLSFPSQFGVSRSHQVFTFPKYRFFPSHQVFDFPHWHVKSLGCATHYIGQFTLQPDFASWIHESKQKMRLGFHAIIARQCDCQTNLGENETWV